MIKNKFPSASAYPLFLLIFIALVMKTPLLSAQDNDLAAIEELIQEAYLDGAYNERVERNVNLGFSAEFKAYYWDEIGQKLRTEDLSDWLERIRQNPGDLGQQVPGNEVYRHKIISSKVYRSTAQIHLHLYQGKELLGTRYCTLFKYPEGWKIAILVAPKKDDTK